jgi:hypothetical protein
VGDINREHHHCVWAKVRVRNALNDVTIPFPGQPSFAFNAASFRIAARQDDREIISIVEPLHPIRRDKPVFLQLLARLYLVEVDALHRDRERLPAYHSGAPGVVAYTVYATTRDSRFDPRLFTVNSEQKRLNRVVRVFSEGRGRRFEFCWVRHFSAIS